MPEPAGTRSLEDILASIRKSLSDETVDGLVQLSAAAAAAARAEASPGQRSGDGKKDPAAAVTVADALADDLLRDKLAGALSTDEVAEAPPEDLSELLAEPSVSLVVPGPAAAPAETAGESALSKLWFIRPGKLEEGQGQGTSPGTSSLEIDPLGDAGAPPRANGEAAATLFSRSASQLMSDGKEVAQDAPTVANVLKEAAPRLDREKIELLNKLRASNAAAVEKIARENAEAEAVQAMPEPEAVVAQAPPPVAEPVDLPPAADPQQQGTDSVSEMVPEAATPEGEQALRALLTLPERSTPLFGALPDGRRPIVTSAATHLIPEGEDEPLAPPGPEAQSEPKPVAETPGLGHADKIDSPAEPPLAALVAEIVDQEETTSAPPEIGPVVSEAQLEEAAPVPAGERSLEDMIAAVLEPVLHRLIEKNLEPLVEALVRREVEKALKAPRQGG